MKGSVLLLSAIACASMWGPLLCNRAGDRFHESKEFSKDELAFKHHERGKRM